METKTPLQEPVTSFFKTKTVKMIIAGALILVLLIPLTYIKKLINERAYRQESMVHNINEKWGREVLLYGPVLKIPYKKHVGKKRVTDKDTKKVYYESIEEIKYAYFFPEKLDISSRIDPEEKRYGIYETAVYKSEILVSGVYTTPDFSEIDIKDEKILWDKARLIFQTSNLKGVNTEVTIKMNNGKYSFASQYNGDKNSDDSIVLHKLESKYVNTADLPLKNKVKFSMKFNINGSKQIQFIPVGKETTVQIASNWPAANFTGKFLPHNPDKIHDNGFNAKWKVLDINRPFPQQFFNYVPDLKTYAFGVNFMIPVDDYQKSERSAKYGYLVIGLTFLIFFLIQIMSKINIHPFQYLMIGLALVMFYTLLISISEHSSFLKAYAIATVSVVTLLTAYSKTILKQFKFSALIGGSLTMLYLFIFVIIQLENYALLVGSIGLFTILAIVMFASRKIDWSTD